MRKSLLAAAAMTTALLTVTAYAAIERYPARGPVLETFRQLELSDAQRSAIRDRLRSHRDSLEYHRRAMQAQKQRLLSLDAAAETYESEARAFADQAAVLARQRVQDMADLRRELAAILTPEQRAQALQSMQDRLAQGPGERATQWRQAGRERLTRWADELALSEDQRGELRRLLEDFQARSAPDRVAMRDEAASLLTIDPESADYDGAVQGAAARSADRARDRALRLVELRGELAAVLSDEQRDALLQRLERGPRHSMPRRG